MKITVVGSGYVGLCTAVGFASLGHDTVCIDTDKNKVTKINSGVAPIYEDGLDELLKKTVKQKRLHASTELASAGKTDFIFIAVGTPSKKDGGINLDYIEGAARDVGGFLARSGYCVVVVKSTVLPETTDKTILPILEKVSGKKAGAGFGLVMNPEFLREGTAMQDFFNPDRIIIGEYDKKSGDAVEKLYKDFKAPIKRTRIIAAEFIKYASNAFLATKISFINELGNVCKKLGVDVYDVADGMGLDKRISRHFLSAGVGFGGSCFGKDVSAIVVKTRRTGENSTMLDAVLEVNKKQPIKIVDLLKTRAGKLNGKTIAVLGLAFKAGTDDVRDAPSIPIIAELLKNGCTVNCYDPKASDNMKNIFPKINYFSSVSSALKNADACLILTEWDEFRKLTDSDFSKMKNKLIIEGRRVLDGKKLQGYEGLCW